MRPVDDDLTQIALDEVPKSSPIRAALGYWRQIAPDGKLPGRQHLEPLDIPPLLPWLFLVDVLREPQGLDFRYRLIGTANVDLVGRDATQRRVREAFAGFQAEIMMLQYSTTVEAGQPTFWRASLPADDRPPADCYRGLFPFAKDGRNVDMLLGLLVPQDLVVAFPPQR